MLIFHCKISQPKSDKNSNTKVDKLLPDEVKNHEGETIYQNETEKKDEEPEFQVKPNNNSDKNSKNEKDSACEEALEGRTANFEQLIYIYIYIFCLN